MKFHNFSVKWGPSRLPPSEAPPPLETINIPKGLYGFEAWAAAFPRNPHFREIVKRRKLQILRNFSFLEYFHGNTQKS